MFKKVVAAMVAAAMVFSLAACGEKAPESQPAAQDAPKAQSAEATPEAKKDLKPEEMKGEINFWHFNKDEAPNIVKAFNQKYPNIKVNLTVVSDKDQQYINKLTAALRSGSGVPDVFSAESAFVKRVVDLDGAWDDISDKAQPLLGDIAKYTVEVGTSKDGKIRALSHQVTAGAIGYKKEAAKKYLGTDDPDKISEMLSSQDKILETSKLVKEKSGGKVTLFPGWEDLKKIYLGGRETGWVKDNKLVIDQKISDLIDISKQLRDGKLDASLKQWDPAWAASIAADEQAIAYCIPTWGVPWIIGSNDKKAADGGRWGIAKAPFNYFWGGTWYGIYAKSQKKDLAWEFVKWFTTDKEHLKQWNKDTGDIPSSLSVLKEGAASSDTDKIMGVNLFKFYEPLVGNIKGSILTQYDDTCENEFTNLMPSFLSGKISSKEEFLKQFKAKIKSSLKDITVE